MFDVCSITNSPIEPLLIDPPEAEGQAFAAKLVLDEIFGSENFLNNIVWEYQTRHSSDRFWNRKHDDILLYKNSNASDWTFNWKDEDVMQKLSPVTIAKYRLKDEKGFYRLNGRF